MVVLSVPMRSISVPIGTGAAHFGTDAPPYRDLRCPAGDIKGIKVPRGGDISTDAVPYRRLTDPEFASRARSRHRRR